MDAAQRRGKPQREPADVYSFGVMAYWMFAGALPFDGDDPVVLGPGNRGSFYGFRLCCSAGPREGGAEQ